MRPAVTDVFKSSGEVSAVRCRRMGTVWSQGLWIPELWWRGDGALCCYSATDRWKFCLSHASAVAKEGRMTFMVPPRKAAMTKNHRLGVVGNRNVFCHSSRSWKSKFKGSAELSASEVLCLSSRFLVILVHPWLVDASLYLHLFMAFSLWVCACLNIPFL